MSSLSANPAVSLPEPRAVEIKKPRQAKQLQLMSFTVDGREFAMPIADVQEISPMLPIESDAAATPDLPTWADGSVMLRSRAIAFVDLRRLLGDTPVIASEGARLILVECHAQGQPAVVGMVVDSVNRVMRIPDEPTDVDSSASLTINGVKLEGIREHEAGDLHLLTPQAIMQAL